MDETLTCKSQRKWKTNPSVDISPITVLPPEPGLTEYSQNIENRSDAFNLLFTNDLIEKIVIETNRKAESELSTQHWLPIDVNEMRAFFGLLIIAGALNVHKRHAAEHWSVSSVLRQPIFPIALSRNRFELIQRFIRFDDFNTRNVRQVITVQNPTNSEETMQVVDKLVHIREIFEQFVKNCQKAYYPNKSVTVDEQLVSFRGKCSFKVYMKSKPDKYGLKIWTLCDAKNFYVYNMQVYTGKHGNISEKNQSQRVVEDMISVLKPGHRVTCDNFFTSFSLAESLFEKQFTLLGTLRKNKLDIPQQLLSTKNREVQSSYFAYSDYITLVSYLAKKNLPVILLSTEDIKPFQTINRRTLTADGHFLAPYANIRQTEVYSESDQEENEDLENLESFENFENENVNEFDATDTRVRVENNHHVRKVSDANGAISGKEHNFKPYIILAYNEDKGGVDAVDYLLHKYPCTCKTRRWPFRLFQNILGIACCNAYRLFCIKFNLTRKTESRWNFLVNLAVELIKDHAVYRLNTNQVPLLVKDQTRQLYGIEGPTFEFENEQQCITKKRKRCSCCPRGNDVKTKYVCLKCQQHVCLQHGKCITTVFCGKCLESS